MSDVTLSLCMFWLPFHAHRGSTPVTAKLIDSEWLLQLLLNVAMHVFMGQGYLSGVHDMLDRKQ